MALPAFLIPALTGFAISKLTGASTKKALQSALLGAAVGGITQGFGAEQAAKASAINQMEPFTGSATAGKLSSDSNIFSNITKAFGTGAKDGVPGTGIAGFLDKTIPGLGKTTVGEGALYGIGGKLLYDSFVDSAKAPKKSLFYGANVNSWICIINIGTIK